MKDFSVLVKRAIESRTLPEFLTEWRADCSLEYHTKKEPEIVIAAHAFSKARFSGVSLKRICEEAHNTGKEIPFTGIVDERARPLRIRNFLRGIPGSKGFYNWELGDLLPESFEEARAYGCKVMLGHTRPRYYGAICSNVAVGDSTDYGVMRQWIHRSNLVSRFHLIVNPFESQLGIFEIQAHGRVLYHPWQVEGYHHAV